MPSLTAFFGVLDGVLAHGVAAGEARLGLLVVVAGRHRFLGLLAGQLADARLEGVRRHALHLEGLALAVPPRGDPEGEGGPVAFPGVAMTTEPWNPGTSEPSITRGVAVE